MWRSSTDYVTIVSLFYNRRYLRLGLILHFSLVSPTAFVIAFIALVQEHKAHMHNICSVVKLVLDPILQ